MKKQKILDIIENSPETWYKDTHDWISWFIGFCEASDPFVITKDGVSFFEITQEPHNGRLLTRIRNKLGFGQTIERENHNRNHNINSKYVKCFTVYRRQHLLFLGYLFNGNIRCPEKLKKFQKWLEILDKEKNSRDLIKVNIINKTRAITLDSAWLSGFMEMKSCFDVRMVRDGRLKLNGKPQFSFSMYENDKEILISIRDNLKISNNFVLKPRDRIYWYSTDISSEVRDSEDWWFRCETVSKFNTLFEYLDNFGFKSSKNIEFQRFCDIYRRFKNKEHLKVEGLEKIRIKINKLSDSSIR